MCRLLDLELVELVDRRTSLLTSSESELLLEPCADLPRSKQHPLESILDFTEPIIYCFRNPV